MPAREILRPYRSARSTRTASAAPRHARWSRSPPPRGRASSRCYGNASPTVRWQRRSHSAGARMIRSRSPGPTTPPSTTCSRRLSRVFGSQAHGSHLLPLLEHCWIRTGRPRPLQPWTWWTASLNASPRRFATGATTIPTSITTTSSSTATKGNDSARRTSTRSSPATESRSPSAMSYGCGAWGRPKPDRC